MRKQKVIIGVAAHKKYQMPDDTMYLPIHVGREGKEDIGYIGDNTGENISSKNSKYCELTGIFYLWKNQNADYLGLAHYRRHFSLKKKSENPFDNILTYSELAKMLPKYKIFVPKKRNYYIETLFSHYAHTHYASHLEETRKVIKKLYPEYLENYDAVLNRTWGYMFNMMIMKQDLFSDYCEWLFSILFELENRIDKENQELSAFQGRFYGRVSEIIFNVWLDKQIQLGKVQASEIKELPYIYMEKVDWNRKFRSFINAKFLHKKYESSF